MRACVFVALFWALLGPAAHAAGEAEMPDTDRPARVVMAAEIDRAQNIKFCLTMAAYYEGGSTDEPEEGVREYVRTILYRMSRNLPKWGGNTVCGVVYKLYNGVCQFTFACKAGNRKPPENPRWLQTERIVEEELIAYEEGVRNGLPYYYNPRETAWRVQCRWRKELVPVRHAGRHLYFREPDSRQEARELARGNYPECHRAKAAVAKAKAKARTKLAKAKKYKKRLARKSAPAHVSFQTPMPTMRD